MKGTVKSFSTLYNYGFIVGEDRREYFAHWTFILMDGYKVLEPGQAVLFDPYETYRGWQARNVRLEDQRPEERILKPNPFTPHAPVTDPAKFAGRRDSLANAVDALFNHRSVFVSGERGVGKTSLAIQLAHLTQGDNHLLERLGIKTGDQTFGYLVVDHRCFVQQRIQDVIVGLISNTAAKLGAIERRTGIRLNHGVDMDFYRSYARHDDLTLPAELVSRFVTDIETSWRCLVDAEREGLCMLIDEVDYLDENTPTAFFLKAVSEQLQADGYLNTCFIIAGHQNYIHSLYEQHKSSMRLFETVNIKPMSDQECREIIDRALGGTSVTITEEATSRIVSLSAGYPTPVHQLGYHAFRFNRDNTIDMDDVTQAMSHIIGELRYEEFTLKHQRISPGPEEEVITLIARSLQEEITISDLLEHTRLTESVVAAHLGNLLTKGFLLRSGRGRFRFREPLFRLYIRWKEGEL